jgi:Lon protease-like protein
MTDLIALPIFPLPNAVLLPGGVLPLHVFEPRYLEMTRDCLEHGGKMAIAMLRPGYEGEYHGRPPVRPIAGLGTIICSDELPDGRYHLLLRGIARVHIEEELLPRRAYREVRATVLDGNFTRRPEALATGHEQLLALVDRLAMQLEAGGAELSEIAHAQDDAGGCADIIGAALLQDPDDRQRMLEALDAADRIDTAVELLARVLCDMAPAHAAN